MIVPTLFLLAVGLLILYSISFDGPILSTFDLKKQSVAIVIGSALFFFFAFFDYHKLNSHSTKLYFIILLLLGAVLVFGKTIRGNTGWLGFSGYNLQPVEIAKPILVIFLASFLSKKKTQLSIAVRVIVSVVLVFVPVFLILKQPDLGSSIIILASWATLLFISGLSRKNLAILVLIGAVILGGSWFFMRDYQKDRIENFINPNRDPTGSGYNVLQSIVAVGSGKMLGKGLGHGSQSQLNFLPEKRTDFIFAVIVEELGFLGGVGVFILFGLIFWRMKEAARRARDNFGYLLVVGIIVMIFSQFLINVGMNIGIMPVTGVPLPFLSYGGSSMVSVLASLGIVQSVYLRRIRV